MKLHNAMVAALLVVAGNIWCMENNAFPFTTLPKELQREVLVIALNNEINSLPTDYESLLVAVTKIKDFAGINKAFNAAINQSQFCLKMIKNLAKQFETSDMDVARKLGIRCAQERYTLQNDFISFIKNSDNFSMARFEDFLKKGIDLEFTDERGNTPLMIAASYESSNAVIALINKGANLEATDLDEQRTPLTCAIENDENIDIVNALIKKGADVNHGTRIGGPLDRALIHGHAYGLVIVPERQEGVIKVIKILLLAGADPNKMTTRYKDSELLKEVIDELHAGK